MRIITLNLFVLTALLFSCNSDPNERLKEGNIVDNKYRSERFGLAIDIPEGWRLISSLEEEALRQDGSELAEKEFGENRANNWTNLLIMQKGASMNQLMLSYLNYDPVIHGIYQQSRETRFNGTKTILENTPGVAVESVRTVTELDGVDFETFNMLIRKDGEQKGFQILLEKRYNNEEVLLITLTATEREVLEELRVVLDAMTLTRKN